MTGETRSLFTPNPLVMTMTTVAARRRLLSEMARRRAQPGTGSARVFLEERTAMTCWPDLTPTLTGIPWAVVGAVAARAYMPERTTQNLDILVKSSDQEAVRVRLRSAGFCQVQVRAIRGMTWRSQEGTLVDVIETGAAWVSEALQSLRQDRQRLPVLDLPYLVLMKIEAGRTQDLADAARMLGAASAWIRRMIASLRNLPGADFETFLKKRGSHD